MFSLSKEILTNPTELQQILAINGMQDFIKKKKELNKIILTFFKTEHIPEIVSLLKKDAIHNYPLSTLWREISTIPWCAHMHDVQRLHMLVSQTRETIDLSARGLADLSEFTLLTNKLYNGNNGFDNYNYFVKSPLFDINNKNLPIGVSTICDWVYNDVLVEVHKKLSQTKQSRDATEVWVHTGATIVAHFFVTWVDEVCKPRRQMLKKQLNLPDNETSDEFVLLMEAGLFGLSVIKIAMENNAENINVFSNRLNFKFDPNTKTRVITEDSVKTFVKDLQFSQGQIASLVVASLILMLLFTKFPAYFALLYATYFKSSPTSYKLFLEQAIMCQKRETGYKLPESFGDTKQMREFSQTVFTHIFTDSGRCVHNFHDISLRLSELEKRHLIYQLEQMKETNPLLFQ